MHTWQSLHPGDVNGFISDFWRSLFISLWCESFKQLADGLFRGTDTGHNEVIEGYLSA